MPVSVKRATSNFRNRNFSTGEEVQCIISTMDTLKNW